MNNKIVRKWKSYTFAKQDNLSGFAFTYENGAHTFVIQGIDKDNQPVPISGTITGKLVNSAGVTVPLTGSVNVLDEAEVTLTQYCYVEPGTFKLFIFADTACIYFGIGSITASQTGTIAYPTAAIPDVQALIDEIPADYSALSDSVDDIIAAISGEYDPPYAYGDYLYYEGHLLQAAQGIPADEEFTWGHWSFVNVDSGKPLTMIGEFGHCVPYDRNGYLAQTQKLQACNNIGALHLNDTQTLSDGQKRQGRLNMNVAEAGISPDMYGAVGDGVTDDTDAVLTAFVLAQQAGVPVVFGYGKTYCVNKEIDLTKRINIYGNGSTIKAINVDTSEMPVFSTSTSYAEGDKVLYDSLPYIFAVAHSAGAWTGEDVFRLGNWAHVFYIDISQAQFPTTTGKGLINNLTIDCNSFCNFGIFVNTVGGMEFQNIDICGFKMCGVYAIGGFELFFDNIRIAGTNDPDTIGINMYTHDSNFTNIVTKNVGTAIHNVGGDNYYTRVHSWNTDPAIVPVSVMFDIEGRISINECCADTVATAMKVTGNPPVFVSNLNVIHGGSGEGGLMPPSVMGDVVPTVFEVESLQAAKNIRSFGLDYLSPTETYQLFNLDPEADSLDFDWLGNNGASIQSMDNVPASIVATIAETKAYLGL